MLLVDTEIALGSIRSKNIIDAAITSAVAFLEIRISISLSMVWQIFFIDSHNIMHKCIKWGMSFTWPLCGQTSDRMPVGWNINFWTWRNQPLSHCYLSLDYPGLDTLSLGSKYFVLLSLSRKFRCFYFSSFLSYITYMEIDWNWRQLMLVNTSYA